MSTQQIELDKNTSLQTLRAMFGRPESYEQAKYILEQIIFTHHC